MDESKLVQVWQDWKLFPVKFVVQAIGAVPTNQQADALRELGLIYDAKMRRSAGAVMTEAQKTRSNKLGISIRSGHGTGKDAFLAWVYLWLLTCFPGDYRDPDKSLWHSPRSTSHGCGKEAVTAEN